MVYKPHQNKLFVYISYIILEIEKLTSISKTKNKILTIIKNTRKCMKHAPNLTGIFGSVP